MVDPIRFDPNTKFDDEVARIAEEHDADVVLELVEREDGPMANAPDCWLNHTESLNQRPLDPEIAARAEAYRQSHEGASTAREPQPIKATHTMRFERPGRDPIEHPMCREHGYAAEQRNIETFAKKGDAERIAEISPVIEDHQTKIKPDRITGDHTHSQELSHEIQPPGYGYER